MRSALIFFTRTCTPFHTKEPVIDINVASAAEATTVLLMSSESAEL